MSLLLTDNQQEFQQTVRSLFEKRLTSQRVRGIQDAFVDFDRETWAEVAELGAAGVLVPEEYDGLGLGLTDASVVMEETGRVIAPLPLYTALLASAAIAATDDDQAKSELLPAIAAGESIVALAFTEGNQSWIPTAPSVTGGTTVSGTKIFVRDGQFADHFLVLANDGLYLVANGAGVTANALKVLDRSVFAAKVEFTGAPARKLAVGDLAAFLDHVDSVASVLLASAQYGAYVKEAEVSTQYAKDRFQFGRSIGSFQGVKFPLADMATESELAYSLLRRATEAADAGEDEFRTAALAVQVKMQGLSWAGAGRMARIHGGIGFTWDHDSHLFMKQGKTSQLLLGTPGDRSEKLAVALGV